MSKYNDGSEHVGVSQESDGRNFNFYLTKIKNEFYDDDHQISDIWNVKRKDFKKNGISWIVYRNKEIVLEVKESRLKKAEKIFLEKPEGLNFLLTHAKQGLNSVTTLKEKLKLLRL